MSPDSPAVASRSLELITLIFFFFPTRYVTRATNIPSKKNSQSLVSRRTTVQQLMMYGNGHQIIINIWVMMVTLKNNIILLRERNGYTAKQPEKKTFLAVNFRRNPRVKVLQIMQEVRICHQIVQQ